MTKAALREAVARAIDPGDWSSLAARERAERAMSVVGVACAKVARESKARVQAVAAEMAGDEFNQRRMVQVGELIESVAVLILLLTTEGES